MERKYNLRSQVAAKEPKCKIKLQVKILGADAKVNELIIYRGAQ